LEDRVHPLVDDDHGHIEPPSCRLM
jgi:hypothetical protein